MFYQGCGKTVHVKSLVMIKLVVSHGDGVVCIKHKPPPEMLQVDLQAYLYSKFIFFYEPLQFNTI